MRSYSCYDVSMFESFHVAYEYTNHRFLARMTDVVTRYVALKKRVYQYIRKETYPLEKANFFLYDGGGGTHKVVRKAMSGHALALLYGLQEPDKSRLRRTLDAIWLQHPLCQAVRNRLRIVSKAIETNMSQYPLSQEVRIVSIACGLAPAIFENIVHEKQRGRFVRALLVDQSQDAIDAVIQEAHRLQVGDHIETLVANALDHSDEAWSKIRDFEPHISEVVGILDYLSTDSAIDLCKHVRKVLLPGGLFITANIMPNRWEHFLKVVVNWSHMEYRSKIQFEEIIADAGFSDSIVVVEPWHMFQVALCSS